MKKWIDPWRENDYRTMSMADTLAQMEHLAKILPTQIRDSLKDDDSEDFIHFGDKLLDEAGDIQNALDNIKKAVVESPDERKGEKLARFMGTSLIAGKTPKEDD